MRNKLNNKGVAVVYLAVAIIVLVAFVGLAVDIGYMYVAKGQLQNAADAAALAGAQKLNPKDSTTYAVARAEAKKYAELNKVAGTFLKIKSDGTNSMSDDNDITLGHWDCATRVYQEGVLPFDAIRVRTRRTAEAEQGEVSIFFGKVIGWARMSAAAEAVAGVPGLGMPALSICISTCDDFTTETRRSTAINLQLQEGGSGGGGSSPPPPTNLGIAWTAFSNTQAPNIGNNGDVADFIRGTKQAPVDICTRCITTNNGVSGDILKILDDVFRDPNYDVANKDYTGFPAKTGSVTRWRFAVPVLDGKANNDCTGPIIPLTGACPPGNQGTPNERYHVQQLAMLEMTDVIRNPSGGLVKGIMVDWIYCIACPSPSFCPPSVPSGFPYEFKLGSHAILLK